jgi:serine O-acetyltransferase
MNNIISQSARIDNTAIIGNFCVVGANVEIGKDCVIGNGIIIHPDTIVGNAVRIDDNTVLGKLPMKSAQSATTKDQELSPLTIGDNSILGTAVIIYRGATIGEKVLVADLASIRENVTIGDFTIIGRGVTVENFCKIGKYCKLETNVYLTAYSDVEDRVFIAPCVATSNDNYIGRTKDRFQHFKGITVKRGGRIGVGAVVLPGKTIGSDALVAAGALITADVPAKKIVVGMPAKVFRDVPPEQLLENQGWE